MKQFIYMQSIVNYRIPVKEDGTLGAPQIQNKWTKEMGAPKKRKPVKKTIIKKASSAVIDEVEF